MTAALITATASTHYDGPWGDDGPGPFPFFFLGFWLVAIVVAVFVWRRRDVGRRGGEAVLAERYARGDIDDDEFRQRRAVLRETGK